jgi:hypothetical protein
MELDHRQKRKDRAVTERKRKDGAGTTEKTGKMEQEPQRKERRWTRNHVEKRKVGAGPQRKEERWSRNHRELEHQPREKRKDGA